MGTVNLKDSLMEKIDVEDKTLDDDPLIWDKSGESFSDHYQRLRTLARQEVRSEEEDKEVEIALDNLDVDSKLSEKQIDRIAEECESRIERIIQDYAR